jgi:imidazolonepropionase-like amidohydrolase
MTAREQRNRITAAWILGILLLLPGCQPAGKSAPGGLFTLEHGTLINPGARPVPNANVVVANGRISCAGTASECPRPADSKPIDVNGTYVGPGLIDTHVHYSQTGWVDGRPDVLDVRSQYPYASVRQSLEAQPERFHRAALCSGVTSVFDVGGYEWTFDLARKSRESADAPRVVATGPLLATIPIDPDLQDAMVLMKDEASTRAAVRSHRAHGAEAIKVWYIEVPDSVRPHAKAMILAAADESRKGRLPLVVHATELQSSKDAVEAGAAVLVHEVFRDTVDGAWLAAVKRAGTIVIPTLSVLDGYADVMLARAPASRYPVDCVDRSTRRKLETVLPDSLRAKGAGFWRGPGAALRRTAAHNLQRTYSAGIPIAMGSDAGNPGTAHGPAVFAEMEAMQQAGMPAIAVFASATIQSARAMGLEREVGSIAAGKRADLVVFGADPTRDIRNARQVRWVMRNAVLRSREELLETVSGER